MEFTKHSPKVRRHIRAVHAGIDSPSPSPMEDDSDESMGLEEQPSGQAAAVVAVTGKGSAAVAGNVRVQLPPPARGIKRARSA
jgi:hypothetical protein